MVARFVVGCVGSFIETAPTDLFGAPFVDREDPTVTQRAITTSSITDVSPQRLHHIAGMQTDVVTEVDLQTGYPVPNG